MIHKPHDPKPLNLIGFRDAKTTKPEETAEKGAIPTGTQTTYTPDEIARILQSSRTEGTFCPYAGETGERPPAEPGEDMSTEQRSSQDALLARLAQVEKNTEGWRRFMIGTSVGLFAALVALFALQSMWTQFAINSLGNAQVRALEESRREIDRSIQESRRETDRLADELRRSQQAVLENLQKNQDRQFEQLRTLLSVQKPQP